MTESEIRVSMPTLELRLLNQLRRFSECCEDPQADGHDVDRDDMHALAEFGAVRPAPGGRHYMTDFGAYVLACATTPASSVADAAGAKPGDIVAAALKAARDFIVNGTALGYIRMPDADLTDPAHNTLPMIEAAIASLGTAASSVAVSAGAKLEWLKELDAELLQIYECWQHSGESPTSLFRALYVFGKHDGKIAASYASSATDAAGTLDGRKCFQGGHDAHLGSCVNVAL